MLRPGRVNVRAQVPLPGAQALARRLRDPGRPRRRYSNRGNGACDVMTALSPEAQDHHPACENRIAIHECNHAIVGICLGLDQIKRVLITQPGGQAEGLASGDLMLDDLETQRTYVLAGRAAERLILSAGAADAGGNTLWDHLARNYQAGLPQASGCCNRGRHLFGRADHRRLRNLRIDDRRDGCGRWC